MRLSATRARFSLIPNRPVSRTSWATGSSGGSMPRSALARTDRAVSGGAPSGERVLLACVTCPNIVIWAHGRHHGARCRRPARRPAERAAAGQRHGPPSAAGRPAPHRRRAQRPLRGRRVDVGRGHRRRCRLGRPVVVLPDRLRADGADVRPLCHPHARVGAQAPLHQQAVERPRGQVDRGLSGLHPGAALPSGHFAHHKDEFGPTSPTSRTTRPTRAPGGPCGGGCSATRWGSAVTRTSCRW